MNRAFVYSDRSGSQTLSSISKATAFNRWMYSQIKPYTYGKTLEIGSGIGNISAFFLRENRDIHLSDINEDYLTALRENYGAEAKSIQYIDIADANFDKLYQHLLSTFDSVFCLNVIEHVENDRVAINNLTKLLKPSGSLIILVPAFNFLYNGLDRSLGHYKRYRANETKQLFPTNVRIHSQFYFNAMGIAAWILGGAILKFDVVPEGNMSLYNRFVPLWKTIDKLVSRWIGLSLIIVGEKRE